MQIGILNIIVISGISIFLGYSIICNINKYQIWKNEPTINSCYKCWDKSTHTFAYLYFCEKLWEWRYD